MHMKRAKNGDEGGRLNVFEHKGKGKIKVSDQAFEKMKCLPSKL